MNKENANQPEVLDAEDFKARIEKLERNRRERLLKINALPRILVAVAGGVMAVSAVWMCLSGQENAGVFLCRGNALLMIPIGLYFIVFPILLKPRLRAWAMGISAIILSVTLVLILPREAVIGLNTAFLYFPSPSPVSIYDRIFSIILITPLFIIASAFTLRIFPSSKTAGLTAVAAGALGLLASCIMLTCYIKPLIEGYRYYHFDARDEFASIIHFFIITLFSLLVVLHLFAVFAGLTGSRMRTKRFANITLMATRIAAYLIFYVSFLKVIFPSCATGSVWVQEAGPAWLYILLYFLGSPLEFIMFFSIIVVIIGGLLDLYGRAAFSWWSKNADVEISRMEQEIAAFEEDR
jgi:hypothetical protein